MVLCLLFQTKRKKISQIILSILRQSEVVSKQEGNDSSGNFLKEQLGVAVQLC